MRRGPSDQILDAPDLDRLVPVLVAILLYQYYETSSGLPGFVHLVTESFVLDRAVFRQLRDVLLTVYYYLRLVIVHVIAE